MLRTVLRLVFSLLLVVSRVGLLQAGGPQRYAVPDTSQAIALLTVGKTTYLVTEHSVLQREGRQFVRHYQSATPIRCALATDTALWLGTQQGLIQMNPHSWQARPLVVTTQTAQAPVTTLFRDAAGTLWVGMAGYGLYQQRGGSWQNQLSIPTVNAGLSTPDSAVWVATNIGLYRWQHQQWTRYNEEGVANHEIPDNMVEQLLLDNAGSLWVLMSEGISVFAARPSAETSESHLPTVKYLGHPGNEVHSVAYVPGQGHVFATGVGLLRLPAEAGGQPGHFEPSTDKVETPQVLLPVALPGSAARPSLLQVDARQQLWVVRAGEVSVWSVKAFRKATQPAVSAGLAAQSTSGHP